MLTCYISQSAGLGIIEWGGTWSDNDGGAGVCGTRLGLCCGGSIRVHVHQDGWGACRGGWNESEWVRIGESLTLIQVILLIPWSYTCESLLFPLSLLFLIPIHCCTLLSIVDTHCFGHEMWVLLQQLSSLFLSSLFGIIGHPVWPSPPLLPISHFIRV